MHSNKTENKLHRPTLRYGQLRLAQEWKTLICFLSHPCNFWLIFKHFPHKKFCIFFSKKKKKKKKKKNLHFLQPVISKTIKLKRLISQKSHIKRNHLQPYTQMVISQKVRGAWTWFWYQIKTESVLLMMTPKPNFTQNVTCSLFCGSASHIRWLVIKKLESD